MKTLLHYTSVYGAFMSTCFSQAMSFRLHFVLLVVMDLFFCLSALLTVDILYQHVEAIGVWNREEFLFFISFMLVIDQLHMAFISRNFWDFSVLLRTGGLDFVLLRPIGVIFHVFFRYLHPASALIVIFPASALVWYGSVLGLTWLAWLLLPLLLLLALTLMVSLEILLSMGMFWTIQSLGINFIRMQLQQLARWPDFVYRLYFRKLFTFFIPILLIGSAPVKFLFDGHVWQPLLGTVASILICWLVIRFLLRVGLRKYESASS